MYILSFFVNYIGMDLVEFDFEYLFEGIWLDFVDVNFVDVIYINGVFIFSLGYGLM